MAKIWTKVKCHVFRPTHPVPLENVVAQMRANVNWNKTENSISIRSSISRSKYG